jgi:hypothetical protein
MKMKTVAIIPLGSAILPSTRITWDQFHIKDSKMATGTTAP